MNLLNYTKILSEKISYYDRLTREAKKNFSMSNPFAKPVDKMVIWVENCPQKKSDSDSDSNNSQRRG